MHPFLKEMLENDIEANRETILSDYESHDGYKVIKCPFVKYRHGIGPDGEESFILSNVMYQITKIIEEMRKEGIKIKEYYPPEQL